MDANLEFQYEQVVTWLEQYQEFRHRIVQKSAQSASFSASLSVLSNIWALQRELKPLSGRTPEWIKRRILESAAEEDKRNDFFPLLLNDYRMEAISALLITRFAGYDLEGLNACSCQKI